MLTMLSPGLPAQNAQQSTTGSTTGGSATAAKSSQATQGGFTIKATSELVLVNVVVRDKNGDAVRGLSRDDFQVLEDTKPQTIQSFDFENIENVMAQPAGTGPQQAVVLGKGKTPPPPADLTSGESLRDRRLVVLFFDMTGMEPEDIDHAAKAAQKYCDQQMTPADLVAVVMLTTDMQIVQDFSSDRDKLHNTLAKFTLGYGQGTDIGLTGDTEGTADDANAFTPDETEYNIFNTDRKLQALESLSKSLGQIEQKKSIIYFSGGVQKTGIENQTELRAAVDAAIKNNVAIYSLDVRGLQALPPGGEARSASIRGVSAYNGGSVRNALDSNFASQETLTTLSEDTGGRAFTDSNDLGKVFTKMQADTATYYVIGYRSNNPLRDGRYRHISVKLKSGSAYKLEYRSGYYAPRDFKHSTTDDREDQIQRELASELPATDLPVYLQAAYFRQDDAHYFVPVSIVVPGSEIPFTSEKDKDKATLDIAGYVRNDFKLIVGSSRDTVRLNIDNSQEVKRKNVQYSTGFTLAPGNYHLKFVVRENQTGRIGSFETDLNVPDLRKAPLRMSSVLMGSQLNTSPKKSLLVHDGAELVPNVTHVFTANQKLYFYYEVYEPAKTAHVASPDSKGGEAAPKNGVHLLTSIAFFNGKLKTYETQVVEATELNTPDRKAAVFQLSVPLASLRPGFYTAQVNVIDDAAAAFAFPRLAMLVRK